MRAIRKDGIGIGLLVLALLPAPASGRTDPGVCAYALAKTDRLIPDLCAVLDSNAALRSRWEKASAARSSRRAWGMALGGAALLLGTIATANAIGNADRCVDDVLGIEDDACDDTRPVMPFWTAGGMAAAGAIVVFAAPDAALDSAMGATRAYLAGRTGTPGQGVPGGGGPSGGGDAAGGGLPGGTVPAPRPMADCDDLDDRVLRFKCFRDRRQGIR